MAIVAEDVERVKSAADLVQIASEHVQLRKVGRRWQGLCPFHAEKTPSFSINNEEGFYHCFGCQASGDVISFVREVEHLDFVAAVERLAGKFGVTIRYDSERASQDHKRRARLIEAMEAAVAWYHERLLSGADAGRARGYLRSRGYDREAVEQFRLGWAPDDWAPLSSALRLPDDVLRDTGLGFVNRRGRQQDFFRGRLMFPIFDVGGHPVAFGGRVLPGGEGPKYKNSQDSAIYSKSRTLYGLNWAKQSVAQANEVIVCEGYTDVIAFFRAGVPRAVATCGTALADDHFRQLKNFARRIVLAYDADAAGQAAAERFYAWEQQYEIDIVVAALPAGKDPGDLGREDPDALRAAVENARPFLAFRLERAFGAADLRTAEGRARAAATALELVGEHPNELVRDQYLMEVADRCRVEPAQLRSLADKARGRGARDRGEARAGSATTRVEERRDLAHEVEALRLAVHRPADIADRVEEVLFIDEVHRAAFHALAEAETLHEAVERAGPQAGALLRRLAVEDTDADAEDVVALLVYRAAQRALTDLEAEARATASLELSPMIGWVKLTMEELWQRDAAAEASRQLVAWLTGMAWEGE